MRCEGCGNDNREGVRFCEQCGIPLAARQPAGPTCPSCGTAARPDIRFCEQCGTPLAARQPAGPTCPSCGAPNREGVTYCEQCGTMLTPPVTAPGTGPPRRSRRRLGIAAAVVLLAGAGSALAASGVFSGDEGSGRSDVAGGAETSTTFIRPATTHATGDAQPGTTGDAASDPAGTVGEQDPPPVTVVGEHEDTPPPTPEVPGSDDEDTAAPPPELVDQLTQDVDDSVSAPADQVPGNATIVHQLAPDASRGWDSDADGLSDWTESELAQQYVPVLLFDEEETSCLDPVDDMAMLWQATPSATFPAPSEGVPQVTAPAPSDSFDEAPYVVLTFVSAYTQDCGAWGMEIDLGALKAHPGDTETAYLVLRRTGSWWEPAELRLKRHYEPVHTYTASELRYTGTHPAIWVSESKHASYISDTECEGNPVYWKNESNNFFKNIANWLLGQACVENAFGLGLCMEDCGGGMALLPSVPLSLNVGEINVLNASGANLDTVERETFDTIADAENTRVARLFGTERAWYPDDDFCGGLGQHSHCAGSLSGKWVRSDPWFRSEPDQPPLQEPYRAQVDATSWTFDDEGAWLHLDLSIFNHQRRDDFLVTARFSTQNAAGAEVPALTLGLEDYHDGTRLAVQQVATTVAAYSGTRWDDFTLFVPYSQFFPGERGYVADVAVANPDGGTMATARTGWITVNRPGALDGTWASNINGGWVYDMWQDATNSNVSWWRPRGIGELGRLTFTGTGYELFVEWWADDGSYSGSGTSSVVAVNDEGFPVQIQGSDGSGIMWR